MSSGNRVRLPSHLRHIDYFVLRFDRDSRRYEFIEPNRAQSFDIGTSNEAEAFFNKVGYPTLGLKAMNSARCFGAAKADLRTHRAFGLDLLRIDIDNGIVRYEDSDENRRGLDEDDEGSFDDHLNFVSGMRKVEENTIAWRAK